MTACMFGRSALPILALICSARAAVAQDTPASPTAGPPALGRNVTGPAELAQFDFLAGDWDVIVTRPRAGGDPMVSKATWHNRWIANGSVMMQEWRDQHGAGIELRSFNSVTGTWDGQNLYVPNPGTWYQNSAKLVGGTMVVTTESTAPDRTRITRREIYRVVHADQFEVRTELSRDDGASWRAGGYTLVATRIKG
jgi:hypothetical protein